MPTSKRYQTTIVRDGSLCAIPVPFDPRAVFGKVRAPVKVTINGYTYRSTIAAMGGPPCIPLRRSHREAAGLEGDETVNVRLELDADQRDVPVPDDLRTALRAAGAWDRWAKLSYTHRREHVEAIQEAKKTETRARRIANSVTMVKGAASRKPGARTAGASAMDAYLARLDADKRAALEKLRATIKAAAPDAVEGQSYGLPAFKLNGKPLVALGASPKHCAFYPMSGNTIEAFKRELAGFQTSKGTVRFTPDKPVPASLVRRMVQARVAEIQR
jgi:uncharacterized protein YdhG (YjbR/CyaY superfamily)